MIRDIRDALEDGSRVEYDLVIVGAGPAGITLALALAGGGQRIALVEAGGLDGPSMETQDSYRGETVGLPYPLEASRQRWFGGTSNHWGGWCRPLDAIDMAERHWVSETGWPFDRSELEPWYRRAIEVLEIPGDFDEDGATAAGMALLPDGEGSGFYNRLFRFSPPVRFGRRDREALVAAPDIDVFVHAPVTELRHDGGRVAGCRVSAVDGSSRELSAGRVVLATGGLEVPRLLLHTASNERDALGNQAGWLGRCFMEHYGYSPGFALLPAELRYDRHEGSEGSRMPVLAPNAAFQRTHGIMNACIQLTPTEPHPGWPPEALATPGLARGIDGPAWLYRMIMINEPSPNPESRITLADERDELGLRRLRLDWRIRDRDLEGIEITMHGLARWLGERGLGRVRFSRPVSPETTERFSGGLHHMGTTRMSKRSADGVVDPNGRVHGTENLYIASSSVFPTAGYANPTLTIVALSLRLAEHLSREAA